MLCVTSPSAARWNGTWPVLCLLCLTLQAGCGASPLPLSVAGSQSQAKTAFGSPGSTTGGIEIVEPTAASDEAPSETAEREFAVPSHEAATQEPNQPAAHYDCKQLVGCWRDSFCGQRTLTLKADGSATMHLQLDFAGRLLYGKTLEFDMRWSLDGSILSFEIQSGRPVEAARSAIKLWGEAFEYRLELVDDERLHGWASDDSTLYKLHRIENSNADGAEQH